MSCEDFFEGWSIWQLHMRKDRMSSPCPPKQNQISPNYLLTLIGPSTKSRNYPSRPLCLSSPTWKCRKNALTKAEQKNAKIGKSQEKSEKVRKSQKTVGKDWSECPEKVVFFCSDFSYFAFFNRVAEVPTFRDRFFPLRGAGKWLLEKVPGLFMVNWSRSVYFFAKWQNLLKRTPSSRENLRVVSSPRDYRSERSKLRPSTWLSIITEPNPPPTVQKLVGRQLPPTFVKPRLSNRALRPENFFFLEEKSLLS